jgi:hypothetical protein
VIVVQVFRYRSCIRIRPSPRHDKTVDGKLDKTFKYYSVL